MTGLSSENGSTEPDERAALLGDIARSNSGLRPRQQKLHWSHWPRRVAHLTWSTLVRDYVNVLLIFVPLGIISGALHWDSTVIFTLNFLAIIPLASLLSFATEELAATMGQALGGLMNATFGNAVELIVCTSLTFV
jgi:Ca2+:H+ antiporter